MSSGSKKILIQVLYYKLELKCQKTNKAFLLIKSQYYYKVKNMLQKTIYSNSLTFLHSDCQFLRKYKS